MKSSYYNIHDIVKFKLVGPKTFVETSRYSNYRSKTLDNKEIDFTININGFAPKTDDCLLLDDKYYVKEDYIYCKNEKYKSLKWEIELTNFEKGRMNVNINIKSILSLKVFFTLIEGFIIDPLIHYIISIKEDNLIHASSVELNGKGIVFVARGGAGKTTISTNLIKKGYSFISDNYTILNKESSLIGFVEPLNLFSYNVGSIKDKINKSQNLELRLKYLLYKASRNYIKIFTKVNPFDIFPNKIKEKSNINSIFLIIPNNSLKNIKINKISKSEMIDHIIYNQMIEFPYLNKYIMAYSYVFPDNNFSKHWSKYKKNLEKNLDSDIPFYKIFVPTIYSKSTFKDVQKVIENETST
ncbi:hypothetical protein JCM15415_20960 [Methanobacterium movens]